MSYIKKIYPLDNTTKVKAIYISSYAPRKCGIASFATDLISAINIINTDNPAEIIAMTDNGQTYQYGDDVVHQIRQSNKSDYDKALTFINNSSTDIVCIQHEFGLYGVQSTQNGAVVSKPYLLDMMESINKPIVTTLHTVLADPDKQQMDIMRQIINKSASVVTMTLVSRRTLVDIYGCPKDKVVVIGHGVPDFTFNDGEKYQKKLGIIDVAPVILSSGLLGPGKELEYVINAMPAIVKAAPKAKLFIVGQTHPVIVRNEGEVYREKLINLVKTNEVTKNVEFVNQFLSGAELRDYFQAADFFVTAYSNMQQSVSGTLAWAVGSGKLCISTPYQYAKEMLSDGSGILIEPKKPEVIASNIIDLYNNSSRAELIRKKAYEKGRQCIWINVGRAYMDLFRDIISGGNTNART